MKSYDCSKRDQRLSRAAVITDLEDYGTFFLGADPVR